MQNIMLPSRFILLLCFGIFGCAALVCGQDPVISTDFRLRDQFNQEVSLARHRDKKAVVLLFTSSHCSWATKYEDRIKAIFQAYKDKGVAFIAINSNDSSLSLTDATARMRQESPFPFSYLKDDDQSVARMFRATKTPEVILIIPASTRFQVVYRGKIDDNPLDSRMVRNNYLTDALDAVLTGKRPAQSETPASGCNIRWAN